MPHTNLKLDTPTGDRVTTTTCYMCACRCGIRVHVKDGRVRYIDGNPQHPVNRGVICAKGSAGIRQHTSPARLRKPLRRVGERGEGRFEEIEWDQALALASEWLGNIRRDNPDKLAFFTGRDQSQALTGWWAQQFGTINYAAHGGFCSVNMAAAGMYTLGGSFWEFGEPDYERAKYLMLWGVAEDHDSNPIKLGLGKLKARGAKIVAINPVRTGYGAIADEWVPIRPGTDGLLAGALIHELLRHDHIDLDYLVRYSNAHHLVIRDAGAADDGLIARDEKGRALCAVRTGNDDATLQRADTPDISPAIVGEYTLADGRSAVPAFQLLAQRYLDGEYAPETVAERCGVPATTIRRLAAELAEIAFEQAITLPQPWTDCHGREHPETIGRPVAMHAMRGISAHANGFQTCRALHVLQMLLGAIDTPGSFLYHPPYPKSAPPGNKPSGTRREDGSLDGNPLGYVQTPEDLLVDAEGRPRRIDKAFSWQHPLAAHGMMQSVIGNAWAGDPYPIDTLMMFMANMGWNSSMNTMGTRRMLTDRDAGTGEYRIPHIIYSDAYASEMVAYADLVLPDTTYLERHDCISLLDRPISDAEGAADAIRQPVLAPDSEDCGRDVRAFQDVLLDLGARLRLPGMADGEGKPLYKDFADYMVRHVRTPAAAPDSAGAIGLLAGWRGDGSEQGRGAVNPMQLERYREHGCFWRKQIPERSHFYRMCNRDYLQWSQSMGFIGNTEPVVLQLYCETLQRFRLAAQGHGRTLPPAAERERVARYFDPLPFWYPGVSSRGSVREQHSKTAHPCADSSLTASLHNYPLAAISQRPMFMYHSWGSQNAWLRQIATRNLLYVHPDTAAEHGVVEGDWVWLISPLARIRVQVGVAANVEPGTVWTWNAIGKDKGTWGLARNAPENRKGFLLNHLIRELLPPRDGSRYANADPITGQAAWFDLRVRLERAQDAHVPGHAVRVDPAMDAA